MEDKDLNLLLKNALSSNFEPESKLNTKIMKKARENEVRNIRKIKMSAILVACCVLLCFSIVSFAAWRYLTPKEIAVGLGNELLASAFESSDAILMNETQAYDDYTVTLLGAISGGNLSGFCEDGQLVSERTYVVVGISKTDGTPMPKTSDDDYGEIPFFVSPMIQGLNPWQFNIVTMNGGYVDVVSDGIMYRIIECDNIELFADRILYLAVCNTDFYNQAAYIYDKKTGIISVNEIYEGMNLLFNLPLDQRKADKIKAEQYLKEFQGPEMMDDDDTEVVSPAELTDTVLETPIDISVDEIINNWILISEERVELNEAKEIQYQYETVMGAGTATVAEDLLFESGEVGYSKMTRVYEKNATLFYRDSDGIITVFSYERVD